MFEWFRRKPRPTAEAPTHAAEEARTPMEVYAHEFALAYERSRRLGIRLPAIEIAARKDCIHMDQVAPVLQDYLGRYRKEEILGQAFVINTQLVMRLADKLGLAMTLTIGWFDHGGRRPYEHGEELLQKLLKEGMGSYMSEGLPLHVWLTSPACEVLDVTLPTTLAEVTGNAKLLGRVLYLSNQTRAPNILYHPTIVGEDFLLKIGAAI